MTPAPLKQYSKNMPPPDIAVSGPRFEEDEVFREVAGWAARDPNDWGQKPFGSSAS